LSALLNPLPLLLKKYFIDIYDEDGVLHVRNRQAFRITFEFYKILKVFVVVSRVRVMVCNATLNNILAISSVILVEETGEAGVNHRPPAIIVSSIDVNL
jgi:hypothetical protein